jgi:VIT1/CCC1 family predicted Fe2+/Mn2+ transporter
MAEPHYWFRRKRFGWGLEPGSREGWIATILFFVASVGGVFALMPYVVGTRPWILIAWALAWIAAFAAVVIAKGEKFW